MSDHARERRLAVNEARFREINERLADDVDRMVGPEETVEFVCECALLSCRDVVELTLERYRAMRASPIRFAVVPGHELLEIERVLEDLGEVYVIEKVGAGADEAERRDPR